MTIILPTVPAPNRVDVSPLDFGNVLTPSGGGTIQKINRMGNRHQATVSMPPMKWEPNGRIWAARLTRAQTDTNGLVLSWRQPGLVVGNPGNPVVDGAGQLGETLALRGFTPGYIIREGQFFSIQRGGIWFLLSAASAVSANGAGAVSIPLTQMIRVNFQDGDACEFAAPKIQGLLPDGKVQWSLLVGRVEGFGFTVTEIQ